MTILVRVLNPQYHGRNLVAFNFAAFACISFVVFLSASQPFYLSDVIGISPDKIGKVTGSLGVADELIVIVTSPFIGTLNDRLQEVAWKSSKVPSGSRILQLAGFTVLGVALLGYGKVASHVVPDLYVLRAIFAVGVSSIMGIAVVMLHEATNSDFTWQKLRFWAKKSRDERTLENLQEESRVVADDEEQLFIEDDSAISQKQRRYHGKLSALLGMCTGCGAIFAVSVFLPLPALLAQKHESWTTAECLQVSYTILGVASLLAGIYVFFTAYDSVKQRKLASVDVAQDSAESTYFELMKEAILVSCSSRKVQLAYLGGFIARSSAIATSVFTPLIVYKFYSSTGSCGGQSRDAPQKTDCYNAFIFSAILTGVASLVSLVSTPVWSIVVDSPKLGCSFALLASSIMSSTACFVLCIIGSGSEVYDPRNVYCFVLLSLVAVAQMGAIIASMSLVSKAGQSLEDTEHRVIGSITGLYNLSGGIGILVIAKLGGTWSDHWVFGPFFILGLCNLILMAGAGLSMRSIR
ncbi:hypothetical protein OY671_005104 [Metschnikowia pulcherrima]|nr:hypothetical protein OY671_005104 [Metschnikowia pulcherrima]